MQVQVDRLPFELSQCLFNSNEVTDNSGYAVLNDEGGMMNRRPVLTAGSGEHVGHFPFASSS
jgi:hypothetical protein